MAMIVSFPQTITVVGDGVSTVAVVPLGYTPTAVSLVSAYDAIYNSVSANIASVLPGISSITINFIAPFSGPIQVLLSLSNSTSSPTQTISPMGGSISGKSVPLAIDLSGRTSESDYSGLVFTLQMVLYELRAIKHAVIYSTKAAALDEDDFKAQNFADESDSGLV